MAPHFIRALVVVVRIKRGRRRGKKKTSGNPLAPSLLFRLNLIYPETFRGRLFNQCRRVCVCPRHMLLLAASLSYKKRVGERMGPRRKRLIIRRRRRAKDETKRRAER